MPELFETHRLGKLDRLGSDVIDFSEDGEIKLVIQCKGFEKPNFEESQLQQCSTEIQKFAKLGLKPTRYWLAVNRPVTDEGHRKKLNQALHQLVESGQVSEALLLDPAHLIEKLRITALDAIAAWAREHGAEVSHQYRANTAVVDYIPGVPFRLGGQERSNPSETFARNLHNERAAKPMGQQSRDRKPPRLLLTGSFGFGKTSALLATAEQLIPYGLMPILIRAAELGERAFTNGHGLLLEILKAVAPSQVDLSDHCLSLAADALRKELQASDRWVLLLDAVDENPRSNSAAKLQALWGGIIDTGLPVLASVRSELSELRHLEFVTHPVNFSRNLFELASLEEWSDELIIQFLHDFKERQKLPAPEKFVELQVAIESGRYTELYGDIPKRPLFLGMLSEDAWNSRIATDRLCDLYASYFERKFLRDRFANGNLRPLDRVAIDGLESILHSVLRVMEEASKSMLDKQNAISNSATDRGAAHEITRDELLRAMAAANSSSLSLIELTTHSVLIPAGRDTKTKEELFRFAHASFQDYFLAAWYTRAGSEIADGVNQATTRFFAEMQNRSNRI